MPEGEPVRVVPGEGELGGIAVGLLDEHTLVEWMRPGEEHLVVPTIQWLDSDLRPAGAPVELGLGYRIPSQWVREGNALLAQVWATPTFDIEVRDDQWVHLWRAARPPGLPSSEPVAVDATMTPDRLYAAIYLGLPNVQEGYQGRLPLAAGVAGTLATVGVGGPQCGTESVLRLHGFRADFPMARTLSLEEPCDIYSLAPSNPWLFNLGPDIGLAFRRGSAVEGGLVHYARLAGDGMVVSDPVEVGGLPPHSSVDGGNQPRAVAFDGRVLFTERRGSENTCHAIRVMNDDGSGAADAPWQLPCYGWSELQRVPQRRVTASVELVAVPGGALLVWTEHSFIGSTYITRDYPWDEGVYAVLLDRDGRRGSEVFRVTDSEATALSPVERTEDYGPVLRELTIAAAAEDDHVAVAWYDRRSGAEGIYVRRLRIAGLTPP
ncbi:MAG: hypothetical protein M5U28_54680 [Sandaracinaceae bacterium]|nr:hypothetical protein [Sandaracinaceae bacterium]